MPSWTSRQPPGCSGRLRGALGQEIPENLPVLAGQLGKSQHLFQVTPGGVLADPHTTNAIEGFNRQFRKVTKAKSEFPTDDSLLEMLYLAMMNGSVALHILPHRRYVIDKAAAGFPRFPSK